MIEGGAIWRPLRCVGRRDGSGHIGLRDSSPCAGSLHAAHIDVMLAGNSQRRGRGPTRFGDRFG